MLIHIIHKAQLIVRLWHLVHLSLATENVIAARMIILVIRRVCIASLQCIEPLCLLLYYRLIYLIFRYIRVKVLVARVMLIHVWCRPVFLTTALWIGLFHDLFFTNAAYPFALVVFYPTVRDVRVRVRCWQLHAGGDGIGWRWGNDESWLVQSAVADHRWTAMNLGYQVTRATPHVIVFMQLWLLSGFHRRCLKLPIIIERLD